MSLLAFACLMAGCALWLDPEQARICRSLPIALERQDAAIVLTGERTAAFPNSIRIDYEASAPGESKHAGVVLCGFEGHGFQSGRVELSRVETLAGPLSPLKLHILKRWWLPQIIELDDPLVRPLIGGAPSADVGYLLQNLVNALPLAAIQSLLALSYALIYGLTGRILFGFGEIAIAGGFATVIAVAAAMPLALSAPEPVLACALGAAVVVSALAGRSFGALLSPLLAYRDGFALIVASVGLAIALPEALRLTQGADDIWIQTVFRDPRVLLDASGFRVTATPMQGLVVILSTLMLLLVFIVLARTGIGRAWRAVAEDPSAAALVGIDHRRVLAATFAASGALAGVAGFLLVANYGGIGFSSGLFLGLKALLAAVVGGVGSLAGAALAGALIGVVETFWSGYLVIAYKDVAILSFLVFLLILRPGGLLGIADRTPRPV